MLKVVCVSNCFCAFLSFVSQVGSVLLFSPFFFGIAEWSRFGVQALLAHGNINPGSIRDGFKGPPPPPILDPTPLCPSPPSVTPD